MLSDGRIAEIARTVHDAGGASLAPFTGSEEIGTADAYRVTAALASLRRADGARPVGRKIGFTNRTIWPIYDVHAPVWGHVWDRTLVSEGEKVALSGLSEPRIEPEIVFGLATTPHSGMNDAEVLACCAWVAAGFEVVQSPYPGWRFTLPDTIIAGGMHGRLLIGARQTVSPEWLGPLSGFSCTLSRDGEAVETGASENVLGGPLKALRHLAGLLAEDDVNEGLAPGEVVTTGTLTDAWPVRAGETWSMACDGLDVGGISITFA